MIDFNEDDLIPEIKEQIELLNKEATLLETEIKKFKSVYEELDLLKLENQDLKERLSATETKHDEFVASFKKFMEKRDDALKFLLQEVKNLNAKMSEIRVVVNPNINNH